MVDWWNSQRVEKWGVTNGLSSSFIISHPFSIQALIKRYGNLVHHKTVHNQIYYQYCNLFSDVGTVHSSNVVAI